MLFRFNIAICTDYICKAVRNLCTTAPRFEQNSFVVDEGNGSVEICVNFTTNSQTMPVQSSLVVRDGTAICKSILCIVCLFVWLFCNF